MVGKGLMKPNFQLNLACDLGFIPSVSAKRDQVESVTSVGLGLENYTCNCFSGHGYRKQRGSCTS